MRQMPVLLTLLACVALAGCGEENPPEDAAPGSATPANGAEPGQRGGRVEGTIEVIDPAASGDGSGSTG